MCSMEISDRLKSTLNLLPFVEPISSDFTIDGVKVLCRVLKGGDAAWAKVVEKILRAAESAGFKSHVCRLYFLHNDNMVYGWHVSFTSDSIEDAIDAVVVAVRGDNPRTAPTKEPSPMVGGTYTPSLEADSKGNPIVSKQVMSMPFTGMEGVKDRNAPSPQKDGKGGGRGASTI